MDRIVDGRSQNDSPCVCRKLYHSKKRPRCFTDSCAAAPRRYEQHDVHRCVGDRSPRAAESQRPVARELRRNTRQLRSALCVGTNAASFSGLARASNGPADMTSRKSRIALPDRRRGSRGHFSVTPGRGRAELVTAAPLCRRADRLRYASAVPADASRMAVWHGAPRGCTVRGTAPCAQERHSV